MCLWTSRWTTRTSWTRSSSTSLLDNPWHSSALSSSWRRCRWLSTGSVLFLHVGSVCFCVKRQLTHSEMILYLLLNSRRHLGVFPALRQYFHPYSIEKYRRTVCTALVSVFTDELSSAHFSQVQVWVCGTRPQLFWITKVEWTPKASLFGVVLICALYISSYRNEL